MMALLLLGVVLGIRHAFEPDRLAAISVLTREKKNPGFALGARAMTSFRFKTHPVAFSWRKKKSKTRGNTSVGARRPNTKSPWP
jgi:hypothetical protein